MESNLHHPRDPTPISTQIPLKLLRDCESTHEYRKVVRSCLIGDLSGVTEETDGSPSSSEIEVSDSTLKARMEGLVIHGGMDIESPKLDSTTAEVFLCDSQDLSLGLSDDFVSDEWSETSGCIKYDANTSSGKGTDPPQQKRVTPAPNSLLDRSSFLTAIRDAGHTDVTSIHVDAFYGALHELGYPSMNRFSQKYQNSRAVSISKMRSRNRVPQKLLHFLQDSTNAFATLTTTIQSVKRSADSNVFRLYIKLHDHFVVETLAMMYDEGGKRYASISVSAQATSPIRLSSNYNLHASEMIEQIIHASRVLASSKRSEGPFSVRKLSFQGCGEPLLNYDNIVTTCLFVSERFTWNLNQGRITISTIGISPRIYDLTRDLPDVVIAIDLCAPTQEMRCSLLPLAQRYSLNDLLDALENHMQAKSFDSDATPTREVCCPRDKVMIRYIMVRDESSKLACAHELGKLCKNRRMSVNLVPYQRRSFHDEERCPSMRHIHAFMAVVKSYGVKCSVKLPMGASVVDESKQFAVHVESRNSSRGSCIRIKYSDDSKSQIDFWETLASVKKESRRKQQKGKRLKQLNAALAQRESNQMATQRGIISRHSVENPVFAVGLAGTESRTEVRITAGQRAANSMGCETFPYNTEGPTIPTKVEYEDTHLHSSLCTYSSHNGSSEDGSEASHKPSESSVLSSSKELPRAFSETLDVSEDSENAPSLRGSCTGAPLEACKTLELPLAEVRPPLQPPAGTDFSPTIEKEVFTIDCDMEHKICGQGSGTLVQKANIPPRILYAHQKVQDSPDVESTKARQTPELRNPCSVHDNSFDVTAIDLAPPRAPSPLRQGSQEEVACPVENEMDNSRLSPCALNVMRQNINVDAGLSPRCNHSLTPAELRKGVHNMARSDLVKSTGDLSHGQESQASINAGAFFRPPAITEADTRRAEGDKYLLLSNLAEEDVWPPTGTKTTHNDLESCGIIQAAATVSVQPNKELLASLDHVSRLLETDSHHELTSRKESFLGTNPGVSLPSLSGVDYQKQGHDSLELLKLLAASLLEIRTLKEENASLKRHIENPANEKTSELLGIWRQGDPVEEVLSDTAELHVDIEKVVTIMQRYRNDVECGDRPPRCLTFNDGLSITTKMQNQDLDQRKEGNSNLEIPSTNNRIAELQSLCHCLQSEVLQLNRKLNQCEEKMKSVEALAAAHFKGRLGLEARLQCAHKSLHEISAELAFRKATDDVLSIKTQVEIRAYEAETSRLRIALKESREAKAKVDTNMAFLAGLEVDDSDSEEDEGSDADTLDASRNSSKQSSSGTIEWQTGKRTRPPRNEIASGDSFDEDYSDQQPVGEMVNARKGLTVLLETSKDDLLADQEIRDVQFEGEWLQAKPEEGITGVPSEKCGSLASIWQVVANSKHSPGRSSPQLLGKMALSPRVSTPSANQVVFGFLPAGDDEHQETTRSCSLDSIESLDS